MIFLLNYRQNRRKHKRVKLYLFPEENINDEKKIFEQFHAKTAEIDAYDLCLDPSRQCLRHSGPDYS